MPVEIQVGENILSLILWNRFSANARLHLIRSFKKQIWLFKRFSFFNFNRFLFSHKFAATLYRHQKVALSLCCFYTWVIFPIFFPFCYYIFLTNKYIIITFQVLSISTEPKRCNIRYSYNFPISGKQKYSWSLRGTWSECFPICKGISTYNADTSEIFLRRTSIKKWKLWNLKKINSIIGQLASQS